MSVSRRAVRLGGVAMLAVLLASPGASGQTFVLQGEKGDQGDQGDTILVCESGTCTLARDLTVAGSIIAEAVSAESADITGDLTVGGVCQASGAVFDDLEVRASYDLPDCPEGYTRNVAETRFVLCTRGTDEMVRVGDFWVDRYEASGVDAGRFADGTCDGTGAVYGSSGDTSANDDYPAEFPDSGSFEVDASGQPVNAAYACSISGVFPSREITWFQAQAACGLAGKHLCTNAEWQAAAEGTLDPGASNGSGGLCRTDGSAPRAAGDGSACLSNWGAEDMIGNLWEWTSLWEMEPGWNGTQSQWADAGDGLFGADGYWHGGATSQPDWGQDGSHLVDAGSGAGDSRIPAAAVRGGYWGNDTDAGLFALNLRDGPSNSRGSTGFRCCRR